MADQVALLVPESADSPLDPNPEDEARVIADAQDRILGVGAEQYAEGDQQKFETMPLADLVEYAREETLDLINYGVMLTLRIEQLAPLVETLEQRLRQAEGE